MRRLSAATSILAIGLLAIGGFASATVAQDASATADSPAVGAWLLQDASDPTGAPFVAIIHSDGTYSQWDPQGASVGSWESTGPNTGAITITQIGVDPETGAFGSTAIRGTFETAADGESLTATYTVEFVGPDGSDTGQMGPGAVTGTRIAIEPMGTPVAPLTGPEPSPAS